jgi:hypothetical protein
MIGPVPDLDGVFAELREMLTRHASALVVVRDEPGDIQLETTKTGPSGTPLWFAAAQMREGFVSLHLMPMHSHPELLAEVSEPLRGLMQGHGCFNLTPHNAAPEVLAELSEIVDAGLVRYRADGLA